jgi:hypothetical protein
MAETPVILGLLQNQWAREPAKMAAMLERNPDRRPALIRCLLAGSVSGRRLRDALGPWFHRITWDNASGQIAATASGAPPADLAHVRRLLETRKPDVVVAFGRMAQNAILAMGTLRPRFNWRGHFIAAPHPAARRADITARLTEVRTALDALRPLAFPYSVRKGGRVNELG